MYYGGGGGYCSGRCLGTVLIAIVVIVLIIAVSFSGMRSSTGSSEIPANTSDRTALSGTSFDNDCVIDEIGWISNVSSVERKLQDFFDKTGVQPYVYFKAYDAELATDSEKEAYAEQWYEDNIDNEWTFLWVYFAEEDADNDVGYMCYVNGYQVTSVMDSEAVDIFWAYVDSYWYGDLDTDDMIVEIFNSTADRIMQHTTTSTEVAGCVVAVIGIIVAAGIVVYIMRLRRKQEKERNEETERILNTPLE